MGYHETRNKLRPADCGKDYHPDGQPVRSSLLEIQGVGNTNFKMTVVPPCVEIEMYGSIVVKIPMHTFETWAEFYLEEQDTNEYYVRVPNNDTTSRIR